MVGRRAAFGSNLRRGDREGAAGCQGRGRALVAALCCVALGASRSNSGGSAQQACSCHYRGLRSADHLRTYPRRRSSGLVGRYVRSSLADSVNDLRRLVGAGEEEEAAQPVAAKPAAQPKPAPAASAPRQPAARPMADAKSLPPADVDELMVAAARLREARAGSRLLKPTNLEELDQTQFFKRCDEFDAQESDLVHSLQMIDGAQAETRFEVSPSGLQIGRTAPADIVLAGAGVSRAHCLVELVDDEVRVSDLNSTNGTYIDSERIGRTAILAVGSVLRVGNVSFEHESAPARNCSCRTIRLGSTARQICAWRGLRDRPDLATRFRTVAATRIPGDRRALIRAFATTASGETRYKLWSGWPA